MQSNLDLIRKNLFQCSPVNHSWFAGFLKQSFPLIPLHVWPKKIEKFPKKSIVVFYDEHSQCREETSRWFDCLSDCVVLTSVKQKYLDFIDKGIRAIFSPYVHWYLHAIPMRRLDLRPDKVIGDRYFNFLNRRWQPGRYHLITYLFKNHYDLLNTGFVTANTFNYYKDQDKICKDPFIESRYQQFGEAVIELNDRLLDGIEVSYIVENFVHIARNIPGQISIQIETWPQQEQQYAFITEKSMIAIATQQIPLLIGPHPNWLQEMLKQQEFDVFDDIIDQSYDQIDDYFKRVELCVDLNQSYLSGNTKLPDLQKRFKQNQTWLLNGWLEKSLYNIVENIQIHLDHSF